MSETGLTTRAALVLPGRAHRHRVLADGNARRRARGTAPAPRRAPCRRAPRPRPGAPAAAIQLADSFTQRQRADRRRGQVRERLGHRHPPRRRRIDDGNRRAFADGERLSRVALERQQRRGAVGDRHLPRAHALVARAQAADAAVANRDQERLVGHGRRAQHAVDRLGQVDAAGVERGGAPARRGATSRVMRGGLPSSAGRSMSTASLPNSGVVHDEPMVVGGRADDRERAPFALAERAERARGDPARSRARSVPGPRCTTSRAASCRALRSAPRAGRSARRGRRRGRSRAGRSTVRRRRRRESRGSDSRRPAPSSGR